MVVGVEEPRVTSGVATAGAREYNVLSIGYKEQYNYTTSIEVKLHMDWRSVYTASHTRHIVHNLIPNVSLVMAVLFTPLPAPFTAATAME